MKKIPLTQSQVALVDDEDYERINVHKWCARFSRETSSYYAVRNSPRDKNGKSHLIYMHREVMNAQPGEQVDHIKHNTLDQQKSNLRLCTRSQNMSNRRMHSNNTSGYKGVTWCKQRGEWQAYMIVKRKQKHLGYYATAIEAALAYDASAIEYYGEFALTNAMMGLIM